MSTLHRDLTGETIHVPFAFTYADAAARAAATGFTASDVGKLARQLDDNTLWMLTDDDPVITWAQQTNTVVLADQTANTVFAGPATGADAPPAFRLLTATDIPDLSAAYQPLDADLTTIATLTIASGKFLVGRSGVWALDDILATDLPDMVGDAGAGGTKGAVPAPAAGDAAAGKYLDAAGVWSVPPGTGGTIGGSTGATDNALLRADGTGGATLQSGGATLDNNDKLTIAALQFVASTELTIATGAVTVTQGVHTIDTEADAASDDLDTISGGAANQLLIIRADNTARTVVVKHNTGNILCPGAADITLDETYKELWLKYDGVLTKWIVVFFSGGGGSFATLTDANISSPTDGQLAIYRTSDSKWHNETQYDTVQIVIDGAGIVISTGVKGDLGPFERAFTIDAVTMLADQSGSIAIDIWKDTYANFPPTDADSITAAAVPTITTATKSQDTSLAGWTTAVAVGEILRFNVDSCASITRTTLTLKVHY